MTFIHPTPEDEAEGPLADAYREVREKRGTVANLWKAQSLHPAALRAHLDLYLALMHGEGALSRRERELVGVVVSAANRSNYGLTHHADAFSRYVKEPGLVGLVAADPRRAPLPARERALADHALRLTEDPASVKDEDVERLREVGFTDAEILDATLVVAYVNFMNRVASGLGVTNEDVEGAYKY